MFVIQTALHIFFNILSELACLWKIFAFVFSECSVQCEGPSWEHGRLILSRMFFYLNAWRLFLYPIIAYGFTQSLWACKMDVISWVGWDQTKRSLHKIVCMHKVKERREFGVNCILWAEERMLIYYTQAVKYVCMLCS